MEKRKYTIIHHISGESNLLMENIHTFNEICNGAVNTEKINFIILNDMMQVIDNDGLLPADLKYLNDPELDKAIIYCVKKSDTHETLTRLQPAPDRKILLENENLSNTKNLKQILEQVKKAFPADHFAYVYKGHGGAEGGDIASHGFISTIVELQPDEIEEEINEGVVLYSIYKKRLMQRIKNEKRLPKGWEEADPDVFALKDITERPDTAIILLSKEREVAETNLTNRNLSNVLRGVFGEKKLAFVLLDCCWGMSLENIEIFQTATDFLVASADESPASGIGYRQFGEFISREFEYNASELAKLIVANYFSVNYADYYSPIPLFRKMGVSLSCAQTKHAGRLLELLREIFTHIEKTKAYDRIVQCAFNCRDYTYSQPDEYAVFNSDLVWFLENIIYKPGMQHHPDSRLNILAFEAIKEIKLMLLKGFLGTNYPDNVLGQPCLGGYGITFPFPKLKSHYDKSIIPGNEYPVFETIHWKTVLLGYYEFLKTLKPEVLGQLRQIILEYPESDLLLAELKQSGLKGLATRKSNLFSNRIEEVQQELTKAGFQSDPAFKAIIAKLEKESPDTAIFSSVYTELINQPKWRKLPPADE